MPKTLSFPSDKLILPPSFSLSLHYLLPSVPTPPSACYNRRNNTVIIRFLHNPRVTLKLIPSAFFGSIKATNLNSIQPPPNNLFQASAVRHDRPALTAITLHNRCIHSLLFSSPEGFSSNERRDSNCAVVSNRAEKVEASNASSSAGIHQAGYFSLLPSTPIHTAAALLAGTKLAFTGTGSPDTAARLYCAVILLIRPQLRQVPFQPRVDLLLPVLHYVAPIIDCPELRSASNP